MLSEVYLGPDDLIINEGHAWPVCQGFFSSYQSDKLL